MKKKWLLLILICMPVLAQAQIVSTMVHRYADKFYPGEVTMTSGRSKTYAFVELPKYDQAEITVSNDAKHQKNVTLKSDEIESVTLWTNEFPDKKITLLHVKAEYSDKSRSKQLHHFWGMRIAASSWGEVFRCNHTYTLDKKTGEWWADYYSGEGVFGLLQSERGAPCILLLNGQKSGQVVAYATYYAFDYGFQMMWDFMNNKTVAEVFASNPAMKEFVKNSANRFINICDMQYVMEEMAVSQSKHTDELPNISSVPGDDE